MSQLLPTFTTPKGKQSLRDVEKNLVGGEKGRAGYTLVPAEDDRRDSDEWSLGSSSDGSDTWRPSETTIRWLPRTGVRSCIRILPVCSALLFLFIFSIYLQPKDRSALLLTLKQHSDYFRYSSPSYNVLTRVGPRKYKNLYNQASRGTGCSSKELLESVAAARIRPDGKSREGFDFSRDKHWKNDVLDLSDFEYSFDLPNCPAPHVFTPAETCDLVSSFGGLFFRGDSLMRNLAQPLLMILKNSTDIAKEEARTNPQGNLAHCFGELAFKNGHVCRFGTAFESIEFENESACGVDAGVRYEQVWHLDTSAQRRKRSLDSSVTGLFPDSQWKVDLDDPGLLAAGNYTSFVESLPEKRRGYSPVFIGSFGIHYNWDVDITYNRHLLPFLSATKDASPKPLALWAGYTAPAANKPAEFIPRQGPEAVQKYNKGIKDVLDEISPGEAKDGSWKLIDYFGMSDGAHSYDGTHHSFQVNFEKTLLLLNLLDVVWGEIEAAGGVVA